MRRPDDSGNEPFPRVFPLEVTEADSMVPSQPLSLRYFFKDKGSAGGLGGRPSFLSVLEKNLFVAAASGPVRFHGRSIGPPC